MLKLIRTIRLLVLFLSFLSYRSVLSIGLLGGSTEVTTCFEGFVLYSDGTCVREINQDPINPCPEGQTGSQSCRAEVPYVVRCPDGYTHDSGKCSYPVKVDASFFCPTDFIDNGEDCVKIVPVDPVARCEFGELISSNCVSIDRQAAVVTTKCPSDTIPEDDTCWRVLEEFPCTDQLPNQTIPREYSVTASVGRSLTHEKALRGRGLAAPRKRLYGEVDAVAVSKPHPSLIKVIKQICQRRVQVEPQVETHCPMGFTEDGLTCIQERIFPPQPICLTTGTAPSSDGCPPMLQRSPKRARCPDGGPVIANQCDALVLADPLFFCPAEFKNTGVSCVGYLPTRLECPAGLQLINGRCIGKIVRQALIFRISENFQPLQQSVVPSSQQPRGKYEKEIETKKLFAGKIKRRDKINTESQS